MYDTELKSKALIMAATLAPITSDLARRAIGLVDLTSLNDDDDEGVVVDLCRSAVTPYGAVAAVCVWPRFVPVAAREIAGMKQRIGVATVINFPEGLDRPDKVARDVSSAIEAGATEIDLVVPYAALMDGNEDLVHRVVRSAILETPSNVLMKAILETGVLCDAETIRRAAEIAIAEGVDFIKTSTGKVTPAATPGAALVMLEAIRDHDPIVGFKAAGGIRAMADASLYMRLADAVMGEGWVQPSTFRLGSSAALGDLIAVAAG